MDSQSATTPDQTSKPLKLKRLTLKQRIFAREYARTRNGAKAGMKAYDVKSPEVASQIATENMRKPHIVNRIDQILKEAKYNPVTSIRSVMDIEDKASKNKMTYGHSLKASEMLLKLSNTLIEKSQTTTLNMNIDNMDSHDLLILKKKYDKLLEG